MTRCMSITIRKRTDGTHLAIELVVGLVWSTTVFGADQDAKPVGFERNVAPILAKRCLECHSENEPSGKLVLSLKTAALQGGESGPAIVPRDVEKSQLLVRVTAGEMPPPKRGHSQKLPDSEIKILRDWIASGAEWPDSRKLDLYEATSDVRAGRDWWSLQPVKRSMVPSLVPSPPPVLDKTKTVGERASPHYSWLPHGGNRLSRSNPQRKRGRTVTTPSLTLRVTEEP